MFCVLLAAFFTLSAAEFFSSQPQPYFLAGQGNNGYIQRSWISGRKQPSSYDSDNDGYVAGRQPNSQPQPYFMAGPSNNGYIRRSWISGRKQPSSYDSDNDGYVAGRQPNSQPQPYFLAGPGNNGYIPRSRTSGRKQPSSNNSDNDGYVYTYVAGRPTNTCSASVVTGSPGRIIQSPTTTKFYGPYISKIKYLMVSPLTTDDLMNWDGLVKLWLGGVGHHMAILHFKTDRPNTSFKFSVKLCW